jgi:hypothetical protein
VVSAQHNKAGEHDRNNMMNGHFAAFNGQLSLKTAAGKGLGSQTYYRQH